MYTAGPRSNCQPLPATHLCTSSAPLWPTRLRNICQGNSLQLSPLSKLFLVRLQQLFFQITLYVQNEINPRLFAGTTPDLLSYLGKADSSGAQRIHLILVRHACAWHTEAHFLALYCYTLNAVTNGILSTVRVLRWSTLARRRVRALAC